MSATVVLKNAWVHMASDQPKTHLDFEDIDGDHWRIRWYSTLDDDSERHYFFAIEGLKSIKDFDYIELQNKSFCTHQSACELSLWLLSYRCSKIDTGRQGNCPRDSSHTAIVILPYLENTWSIQTSSTAYESS